MYAWAYTFDASLSEDESKAFGWSVNKAEISDSDDNSESNLGTLGTSTDIRLGLWTSNGTNSNYNVNSGIKIGKTAIWKSALTQAELRLLVNYNGSEGSMIYDVSGRYGAAGYTALGVAQPNHEWIPKVDSAIAVTAIADTGSDGGKALSFVGSPKISFHGAY